MGHRWPWRLTGPRLEPTRLRGTGVTALETRVPTWERTLALKVRVPRLERGVPRLERGVPGLERGVPRLEGGVPRLEGGVPRLERGVPRLEGLGRNPRHLLETRRGDQGRWDVQVGSLGRPRPAEAELRRSQGSGRHRVAATVWEAELCIVRCLAVRAGWWHRLALGLAIRVGLPCRLALGLAVRVGLWRSLVLRLVVGRHLVLVVELCRTPIQPIVPLTLTSNVLPATLLGMGRQFTFIAAMHILSAT